MASDRGSYPIGRKITILKKKFGNDSLKLSAMYKCTSDYIGYIGMIYNKDKPVISFFSL